MGGEPNQVKWRGVQPIAGIRGVWPAVDSVRVMASGLQSGEGSHVVYTVPSGKILFISSQQMAYRLMSAANTFVYSQLYDDEDAEQDILGVFLYDLVGEYSSDHYWMPAIEVSAGWKIKARAGAANLHIRVTIFGWLEDA